MDEEKEYAICEDNILNEYRSIKDNLINGEVIICQHLGTFSQDMLISIVSLVENFLLQNGEHIAVKKRLTYLIIECIQNIMFHSNRLSENHQLAYIVIVSKKNGYSILCANMMETAKIYELESRIDETLNIKKNLFTMLFEKKINESDVDISGRGGLGLLTMIEKTGKGFDYNISTASTNYSIFKLKLNIKNI